ncbi:MAG: HupE/UreJ family protein [Planctomycetota bacterium]
MQLPNLPLAHLLHSDAGFFSGLQHPWLGADHAVAMVLVGLLACTGGAATRRAPLVFVLALGLGAGLGLTSGSFELAEVGIQATLALLALALCWPTHLSRGPVTVLLLAAGAAHGVAHGAEATGSPQAFLLGMLLGSAALHALGYGLGRVLARAGLLPVAA